MIRLKNLINEAKQVGIIYHYTTFESGLKVLESNQLKSFTRLIVQMQIQYLQYHLQEIKDFITITM
jgi:phosphoribosylanthranilate isomerase